MKIIIDDNAMIWEVQEDFSRHFPFLKLEFYEPRPFGKPDFARKNLIEDHQRLISSIRHIHLPGYLSIDGHKMVRTLEREFMDDFGINAQVFVRSGDGWIQTIATDEWSLSDLNGKGAELCEQLKN